jgi:hypothetical protein
MANVFVSKEVPRIYIFPRSRETLFLCDYSKAIPPLIYYENYLEKYKDTTEKNLPEMAKGPSNDVARLKEIESRIYVDLWKIPTEAGLSCIETVRKITVGFLKKEPNSNVYKSYKYTHEKPDFGYPLDEVYLVLTIDPKETGKNIYIDGNASGYKFTSAFSSGRCAYIPMSNTLPDYLVEFTLHVLNKPNDISKVGEIEIGAHLIHKEKRRDKEIKNSKRRLPMYLYRCPVAENEDDPFEILKEQDKDKDIFVMPRNGREEKHKVYIRKLQLYSNHVLARHKKMTPRPEGAQGILENHFDFVKEDGLYTDQLGINYGMSVDIFKKTVTNRGVSADENAYINRIRTVFEYNFSTFGQGGRLVKFLSSNYELDENIVRKLVIDRNFIYGSANNDQSEMENIQGLKNLYERVVNVFRQRMVEEAEKYVNFPHRWMPKPDKDYNKNYHRGNLIVKSEMNLLVYNLETGGTTVQVGNVAAGSFLPENAEITFTSEYDKNCEGTIRYKVESIKIGIQEHKPQGNNTWYVPLTYDIKKKCKDNEGYPQNYCDYMDLPQPTSNNQKDIDALNYYKNHNGVPYYISNPDVTGTGGKVTYNIFKERLNIENILNWYSYNDDLSSKPNSPTTPKLNSNVKGGVGLDCSGLIMNCLLDIRYNGNNNNNYNDNNRFFKGISKEKEDGYRTNGENAYDLGSERARLIPLDDIYKNGDDLLVQAGDLIYSQTINNSGRHIALCVIDSGETPNLDNHLTINQKEEKYFYIIHNYGGTKIYTNNGEFSDGFFCKTLKGPFHHWGVALDNEDGWLHSLVGRIYLWY